MRAIILLAIAALFSAHAGDLSASDTPNLGTMPLLIAAETSQNCAASCAQKRDQCFAPYTKSDMRSGNYVTPDGHKVCWSAYHECMSRCPSPNKR